MSPEADVRTASRPSSLKITDLRVARLRGTPFHSTLIRIDTDQGICGYGEVRDGGSPTYALMLKSRLLGQNPCDVDRLFRRIKQFGHHARQAGGVCAVEMALMDLAGRAYGVPAYQLAGGRFRHRVLCYCDTPTVDDGREMGRRLRQRMEEGFAFLKMDIGLGVLRGRSDCVIAPPGMLESSTVMHPFTGIQITERGIGLLCEYVAAVRGEIGYEVPLAADHFGHLGLESCIRLGRALDQFSLAWYEDMIPWQLADQYQRLSESVETPVCTGEDIYLKEGFADLFDRRAIAVAHPDLASAGGILETKKIGDAAQEAGIAMALHMAMSPVAAMASVHAGGGDGELPRPGEPLGGRPGALEQLGDGPARATHRGRPHRRARDPGPRLRGAERGGAARVLRPGGGGAFRPHRRLGLRDLQRPALELRWPPTTSPSCRGDGIAPEVVAEAQRVLDAAGGPELRYTEHPCGAGCYLDQGDPLPESTVEACRRADAVLLGAMGLPDVRWPDGTEMRPQIDLRILLDLYAGCGRSTSMPPTTVR